MRTDFVRLVKREPIFRAFGDIQEGTPYYEQLLSILKTIWKDNKDIHKLHFHNCGEGFTEYRIFLQLIE